MGNRLMQANHRGEGVGLLHDHVHYERPSCKYEPACEPVVAETETETETGTERKRRARVDIEIDGSRGFFTITSRTGAGHDWCERNVQGHWEGRCCYAGRRSSKQIAVEAMEAGLVVAVNGCVYLQGGLRGEPVTV